MARIRIYKNPGPGGYVLYHAFGFLPNDSLALIESESKVEVWGVDCEPTCIERGWILVYEGGDAS
jgi:hypothetical protein